MPKSDWKPVEKSWGDLAYRETMQALNDEPASRAVALCAWCYAQYPDRAAKDIETLAQRDPEIPTTSTSGKKLTAPDRRRAREILGLAAPAKKRSAARKTKKEPKLSAIEKAILARFRESVHLVSEYERYAEELTTALEAFESAKEALHGITLEQARTLADADPHAEAILSIEGILRDPDSSTDSSPESSSDALGLEPAIQPDRGSLPDPADPWPNI